MLERPNIDPDDELVCLGHGEDLAAQGGAMTPPIVQTSLFAHPSFDDLVQGLAAEHRSHVYTRGQNPTVEALEEKLARLEGAEAAKCMASGMAAVAAAGFATGYWALFGLMILMGIGNSVFHPADYAILAARIEHRRLGRAFSLHTFAGHLGWAVAPGTVVFLTALWSWQSSVCWSR